MTTRPWQYTNVPNDACCWDFHVESAERDGDGESKYPIADVGDEADARLIAAAPELLEALRGIVEGIEIWNTAVERIIGRQPYWQQPYGGDGLDRARAAIAKAEGR